MLESNWNFDHHENRPARLHPGAAGEFSKPVERAEPASLAGLDRWVEQEMFEEDVRAVLRMMRPNGRERLAGWKEYRTGGAHFRVTVSWDDEFEGNDPDRPLTVPLTVPLAVPHLGEVIESLLVGTACDPDEITPAAEFNQYRQILCDVYERLHERQSCHE